MPENKESVLNQEIVQNQTETCKPVTEMIDLQKEKDIPIPREIKTWMQKVEEEPSAQPSTTNTNDDSILKPLATTVTKISLPTNKKTFINGFYQPVDNAWKWLSTFVLRIIKKNKGNVKFKEE